MEGGPTGRGGPPSIGGGRASSGLPARWVGQYIVDAPNMYIMFRTFIFEKDVANNTELQKFGEVYC